MTAGRFSPPRPAAWPLLALLGGCASSPDPDPEAALRGVCGDAAIVERDVHPGDEEPSWQEPPLECEVDGHRVEAYALQLLDGSLATQIGSDQDVVVSGDGGTLGWATSERADTSLLEPLEDDGWETGPGYPEE